MKTVLITGFEPFGGESVNPSWEVVSGLDNAIIAGCRVVARQLPCVFGESLAVLNAAIDALSPSLVLAVGQAGGRTDITVERGDQRGRCAYRGQSRSTTGRCADCRRGPGSMV